MNDHRPSARRMFPADRSRRGFSAIELLISIGIVVLLVMLLLPSIGRAREAGRSAICVNNLRQLHLAMIGTKVNGETYMPLSSAWIPRVQDRGADASLICPSDELDIDGAGGGGGGHFERIYMHQHHNARQGWDDNRATYLADLFDDSYIPDNQVSFWVSGKGGHLQAGTTSDKGIQQMFDHLELWTDAELATLDDGKSSTWPYRSFTTAFPSPSHIDEVKRRLDTMPPTRAILMIESIGLVKVDFGSPITISTYTQDYGSTNAYGGYGSSLHFLREGDPDAPGFYDDVMLAKLSSYDYQGDEKVIQVEVGAASYGMNAMAPIIRPQQKQILLIEYEQTVVDVDGSGVSDDDFDALFAPRHLGIANTLFGDGAVIQTRRDVVDPLDPANRHRWFVD